MRKCHIEAGNAIEAFFALQMTPRFLHNLQTGILVHFRHQMAKKKSYVSSLRYGSNIVVGTEFKQPQANNSDNVT